MPVVSFSRRWRGAGFAASLLLVSALGVLGCGGSSPGDGQDTRAQFGHALSALHKLDSGSLDLSLKVDAKGGDESGSFELGLTGPFQSGKNGGADLHLTADSSFPGGEGSFDVGLTAAGQNFYLTYGDQTYELGAAQLKRFGGIQGKRPSTEAGFREACRMQLRTNRADPSACDRVDPSSWIGDFSDEGSESVSGVQTDHLQANIEVRKLVADLFELGKAVLAGQGVPLGALDSDRVADEVDRYVDKAEISAYPAPSDGIPRRLGLDISVDAGDIGGVDLTADLTFDHVNEPQTISAPPGPVQPLAGLAKQLPPPFDRLLGCLLNAKSRAELQACGADAGTLTPSGTASSFQ